MHGGPAALIDEELWRPLVGALRRARREILVSQLLWEPAFAPLERPLADEVEAAARRGVRVRVVVNENRAIPDTADEIRERFAGTRVEVESLPMSPNVMHAKIVAVDGREAFLVDAPFEPKNLDRRTHPYLPAGERGKPFHSVSLRLRGAAASAAAEGARALWRAARREASSHLPHVDGDGPVALAWTCPAGLLEPEARLDVLRAYLDAILAARRCVYVENQYFTSPLVAQAISRALRESPWLEVVLVLNTSVDVPGYVQVQEQRLEDLGYPDHPRLGVFTLRSVRHDGSASRPLYVHSKVCIVDDAWATVGSANLDSIGLHEGVEFPVRVPPNVEFNAIVREAGWAQNLRRRLFAEHLGDEGAWRDAGATDGPLALWRRGATEGRRVRAYGA